MMDKTTKRTAILVLFSQIPIFLLLWFFLKIDGIATANRVMAVFTIAIEAALMFEMTSNIVQKVRANKHHIIVREILARNRVPWSDVGLVKQVVVSPMRRKFGKRQAPVKLFVAYAKQERYDNLVPALEWWDNHGPCAQALCEISDKVKRYDAFVRERLQGAVLLWSVEYNRPQAADELAQISYLPSDDREKITVHDLSVFGGKKGMHIQNIADVTYPFFFREHFPAEFLKAKDGVGADVWKSIYGE